MKKVISGSVDYEIKQTFDLIDGSSYEYNYDIQFRDIEIEIDLLVERVCEMVDFEKNDIHNWIIDAFTFGAENPQNTYGFDINSEIDEIIGNVVVKRLKEIYGISWDIDYEIEAIHWDFWIEEDEEVEIEI